MPPTRVISTNAGSSIQNSAGKSSRIPGQEPAGSPIQGAAVTAETSTRPAMAAAMEPASTPSSGAHRRSMPPEKIEMTTITRMVTATTRGTVALPSKAVGTRFIIPQATGATLRAISISTVPPTAGVRIRRSAGSLAVKRKVASAETLTSVASRAGPPFSMAATATEMKAALEPTNITWPDPMMPIRLT